MSHPHRNDLVPSDVAPQGKLSWIQPNFSLMKSGVTSANKSKNTLVEGGKGETGPS